MPSLLSARRCLHLGRSNYGTVKRDWRGQITGAGLGSRLAYTIRARCYPEGVASINAAALIWSNAPAIVGAHDEGALIRSKDGFWLAIPVDRISKRMRGPRNTRNRLPRPAMALGVLFLIGSAMVEPVWFSSRMQGLALVPEPLW